MLLKQNKYSFLIFALVLFISAWIFENNLLRKHPERKLINEFQQELLVQQNTLHQKTAEISDLLNSDDFYDNYLALFKDFSIPIEESSVGFLIYQAGELKYWSDRSIAFKTRIDEYKKISGFIELENGYYLSDTVQTGEFEIVGLHPLKYNYGHENKYLDNTFFKSYKLPKDFEIIHENTEGSFAIKATDNSTLFYILPKGRYRCNTKQLYFPAILYFLGLLILLRYFRKEFVESKATFFLKVFGLGTALFIVYWLHLLFEIPKLIIFLEFFSPDYFAYSNWLPSLGDYFLMVLFFGFWLHNFAIDLNVKQLQKDSRIPKKIIVALLLLFCGSLFLLANYFIEELIINSTISFALNKIIEISAQSVLGIFSVGLLIFSLLFFSIRIIEEESKDLKFIEIFAILVGVTLFLALAQLIAVGSISFIVLTFFLVSGILAAVFSNNYLHKFSLSYLIIFVSVASVYSLLIFYHTIGLKEKEQQKLFAVTLNAERDPAAEEFLTKIQNKIINDPAIKSLLHQNEEDRKEYIRRAYFNGYFRKYVLHIYDSRDTLFDERENRLVQCKPFMERMISDMGLQIEGTNFYFMDNMNGRISYTGKLDYPLKPGEEEITIYIDLDSDLLFEGLGFPELLIDKSIARSKNYRNFQFAKYYGGELTDKFGDYSYNFYIDNYAPEANEFSYKRWDNLEHLFYHTSEDNYVIVSRDLFTFVEYLISFPYLFVFYFLSILIVLIIANRGFRKRKIVFDLKFKIQASIISIVFVSLLVVALATILYNVNEYKNKHRNDLNEKMKSIAEEIDNRVENDDELDDERKDWLDHELAKLSNIFRTDINVYGVDGSIIASSRSQIFERGLVSAKINANAYYEIFENLRYDTYFQPEKIGELSYLSAYRAIINYRGEHLGTINLPYFIKQDNYSQEISTLVVAFINLYVLLFLASIIIAVFIANSITRPLVVIQQNLQKMQLGKHNEPIIYNRNDEIGSLVKEYNKKVDELAVSARLLARSERESAWREMAKQIAHEIKNPLTPMKLNIQHLQQRKGKDPEYNKYLDRVTRTLIEQIDNLSDIATEFSNFAKIPIARNQVFVLADQLQKVIDLYETHNRAQIKFKKNGLKNIEVFADREQLTRAIINLIKNGIQAIPEEQEGEIKIKLSRREHMAVIAVSDNGTGIPVDLRDKLFSPSFTTKTSGMGLGLAIVKSIVENFSGKIWFKTELGKGTTFYLEIPVYQKEEEAK